VPPRAKRRTPARSPLVARSKKKKRNSHGRTTYHHGDLSRALIEAGLQLVETLGPEAITLRAVARKAKVSHNAPYHHFASKSELLAAVAAAGFDRMIDLIRQQAAAARPSTPLDLLRCVGRGYMLYAVGNPSVFRLMFRPELTRPAEHPLLREAEGRAFGVLAEVIDSCQKAGQIAPGDPRMVSAFCWSGVHGAAMLYVDHVFRETPLGELPLDDLIRDVNDMILLTVRNWQPPR
jgi:AcrR family transcriptional regulator